uniref:MADF domain-containing protein n=1 Tax=Romanomermis culicivorax TaxID=13658 RepID=A0A915JJN3_ROMCU
MEYQSPVIRIDRETFISEIQAKPVLWDPTSKSDKSKTSKEKAWADISKKFNTSVVKCQNFWKNLRDQYVKKRKTIEQMPSGNAAKRAKDWPLFQSMTFLNAVKVENERSISNFDTTPMYTIPALETSDDEKSEYDQTSRAESVVPGPTIEEEPPKFSTTNRKRKRFEDDQSSFYRSMTNLAASLTNRDDDDEVAATFKLMMIKTRRLEKEYPDRVLPLLKDLMDQIDSRLY